MTTAELIEAATRLMLDFGEGEITNVIMVLRTDDGDVMMGSHAIDKAHYLGPDELRETLHAVAAQTLPENIARMSHPE